MAVLSSVDRAGAPEEAGVDVTLAPVLEEEGGVEAGVDMVPIPVLDEEFEVGSLCATASSGKYIGIKSPNTRINAIAVQEVCLIFHYRPYLESLDLSKA